jgi:hypothetical protein
MSEKSTESQQRLTVGLKRKILLWLGLFMLFQFWDSLLGLALHALHILIEYLELTLEHLLEILFHLEGHDGQMATAWIGSLLILALLYRSSTRALRAFKARFRSRGYFLAWLKVHAQENWLFLSLLFAACLGSVFFM